MVNPEYECNYVETVIEAKLTDFCQCITLNHVGNWMSTPVNEDE